MNVYDFDSTIYKGDSTADFIKYCFKKKPLLVKRLPKMLLVFFKYLFRKARKEDFKEAVYSIFNDFDNLDVMVNDFWNKNIDGIKEFYKKQKKADDLIISASPEFIIIPACERLGIKAIGSRIDPKSGKHLDGINCRGARKVERFYELYPDGKIDEFYSDSYSDEPLAKLADKAYIVDGEKITPWNFKKRNNE